MLIIIIEIIFALVIVYKVNRFDYFAPNAIFCFSWLAACVCGLITSNTWNIIYDMKTIFIISITIVAYILGGCFSGIFHQKDLLMSQNKDCKKTENSPLEIINLSQIIILIMSFISVFFLLCLIKELKTITGVANIFSISAIYRDLFLSGEVTLPFLLRQLYRFVKMLCLAFIYIFVGNIFKKQYIAKSALLLVPVLVFSYACIIQGNRSDLMYIFLSALFYLYIFLRKERGVVVRIPFRKILFLFLSIGVLLLVFSQMRFAVGRKSQATPLMYIAGYMSSGVAGFNEYIKNDIIHTNNEVFGGMTFYGIWRSISNYLTGEIYTVSRPFTYVGGISLGNTYTAIYNYYYDFGLLGTIVIAGCISFIFEKNYIKILTNKRCDMFQIIMFSYFLTGVMLFAYDEHIISDKLTFGLLTDVLCLFVIIYLCNVEFKRGKVFLPKLFKI